MKSTTVVIVIAALLTIGCTKEVSSQQSDTQTQPATIATSTASTPLTGTFKAGEHPTQGTVRIVTDNGKPSWSLSRISKLSLVLTYL